MGKLNTQGKVQLSSYSLQLNCHAKGFQSQTNKLEPPCTIQHQSYWKVAFQGTVNFVCFTLFFPNPLSAV